MTSSEEPPPKDAFLALFADWDFVVGEARFRYWATKSIEDLPTALDTEDWLAEKLEETEPKSPSTRDQTKPRVRSDAARAVRRRQRKQLALHEFACALGRLDDELFQEIRERYAASTDGHRLQWKQLDSIIDDLFSEYRGAAGRPAIKQVIQVIKVLALHYELIGKKVSASESPSKPKDCRVHDCRVHDGKKYSEFVCDLHKVIRVIDSNAQVTHAGLAKQVRKFLKRT